MTSANYYKGVIDKIVGLPTLPTVIGKITELMQDPKTVANDIGRAIGEDQALTAKVLKLVNSAFYGFPRRISTIAQAVVILGFSALRNIVLTASIVNLFPTDKTQKTSFDRDAFWTHSIATGIAAKVIAKKIGIKDIEKAFIGGLLHDVGKLILDQFIHQDFEKVMTYVNEKDCLFLDAENTILQVTHSEIGGWLGEKWKLPTDLVQIISLHHQPLYAKEETKLACVVLLADIIVRALGIGFGGDNKIPIIDESIWNELGISFIMIEKVMNEVYDEIERSGYFMSIVKEA
ncbi:MAG: HD family phosphohydrolase [Candidatus Margulisiibacteriota bacterium]|nr:MAG: hypothetical protein A2X43_02280 [Candidatus Margulisbacteria bacterium GWD2_39_127]OGI00902.1 MAG: hypothetical protein A2X42_03155 [Candidatus Margulisbacteria bacterium GWF2_38_17]OGI08757.1 MAG: hypothetical protein A2X41_05410 [Candidatus Margulisbacteria bacterium GWE2_39_32]PZM79468.1 MAG: HD family phosphohydrolase [Candidatus Margulisiibacteriota bacterium]HAR63478.1 HD family phosphohydrolase [Candidatus Margulisiibacteriota bacterium]